VSKAGRLEIGMCQCGAAYAYLPVCYWFSEVVLQNSHSSWGSSTRQISSLSHQKVGCSGIDITDKHTGKSLLWNLLTRTL
jgi:hypothetical protein